MKTSKADAEARGDWYYLEVIYSPDEPAMKIIAASSNFVIQKLQGREFWIEYTV